jgi:hypothetical protein
MFDMFNTKNQNVVEDKLSNNELDKMFANINQSCDLIIDDNTLRGSHIKDSFFTPSKEGEFYCKVSKGLWDEFTCFINLKSKSGAITTSIGKEFRTTTFSIIKKLD